MTFAMVGVIQWYALSATAGAGSSILSADKAGLPVHRGAKQIHSRRPISLKKILHQKPRKLRIAQLSARFSGSRDALRRAL